MASARRALERRTLQGITPERTWKVLEIGCGIGNLLRPLSALVQEAHGVDISGEMLRRGKEWCRGHPNVFLHKTEGRLEMFSESSFDFVFSSGVFIHIPDKAVVYAYFQEATRVLKPGGVFRFNVDGRSYLKWCARKGGTLRDVVFSAAEIKKNLERCGFNVQDVRGAGSLDMWASAVLEPPKPPGPRV